ncbi:hypothetical protein ACET3Z_005213 [Daucus carota]
MATEQQTEKVREQATVQPTEQEQSTLHQPFIGTKHTPNTTEIPVEIRKEATRIQQHWFLLDSDWADAIAKGNYALIPAATARLEYLLKVIQPDLLEKGLKGEEEALWSIHRFSHNNGWWERARNLAVFETSKEADGSSSDANLFNFIKSHGKFVHPNTHKMVQRRDREGIRMALNQIHYGSLKENNPRRTIQANKKQLNRKGGRSTHEPSKQNTDLKDQLSILRGFLKNYSDLIEPSVFQSAQEGDDKALSLALGQIHHHTLGCSLRSSSTGEGSVVDEDTQEIYMVLPELQADILKDLNKLKVKSGRGRPRKFNPKNINRHFKVPKRRKKQKGEGLQQVSHYFLNGAVDEAESIYETGLLMGLLPINSKPESLELIRKNLAI